MIAATEFGCPTCALAVPAGFTFCPRCRAQAEGRSFDPDELDRHERSYVLSLVLLSLGALAIPRLWRSPAFSPAGKVALSVFGVLYTGLALLLGWWFFAVWFPDLLAASLRQRGL